MSFQQHSTFPYHIATSTHQPPSMQDDKNVLVGGMMGGFLIYGQSRLPVTMLAHPPSTLYGKPLYGIEYYYCLNSPCMSLWAVQWRSNPRRRMRATVDLSTYKRNAFPSLCSLCSESLKAKGLAEEEVQRTGKQEATQASRLPEKPQTEISGEQSKMMSTVVGFEDIPLGEPAGGADKTLAEDLSWDFIEESDANEEWSVINHFGSAAIEHRDAHVDTKLVRP